MADGLLHTLFTLARAYFLRGSPREAEHVIKQVEAFVENIHLPAASAQAIVQKCEILLHLGNVKEAQESLETATSIVLELHHSESANLRRIKGDYSLKLKEPTDAAKMYLEAVKILGSMDKNYSSLDVFSPQSS